MPTFIKTGYWEKRKKGFDHWLNLEELISQNASGGASYLLSDTLYKEITLLENGIPVSTFSLASYPTFSDLYTGNAVLRGGVVYDTLINQWYIWATSYIIDGVFYNTPIDGYVTLPTGGTFDRVVIFKLINDGSTPASVGFDLGPDDGTVSEPSLDLSQEVEVGFRILTSGETLPTELTDVLIYDENLGSPTEWNISIAPAGGNPAFATLPYTGSVSHFIPASNVSLQFTGTSTVGIAPTTKLVFALKTATAWSGQSRLRITIGDTGSGITSNILSLTRNSIVNYNFVHTLTGTWQIVSIDISEFQNFNSTTLDRVTFAFVALNAMGIDRMFIQDGISSTVPPPGQQDLQSVLDVGNTATTLDGNSYINLDYREAGAGLFYSNIDDGITAGTNIAQAKNNVHIAGIFGNRTGTFDIFEGNPLIVGSDVTGLLSTTINLIEPVDNTTLKFPAKSAGTYTLATLDDVTAVDTSEWATYSGTRVGGDLVVTLGDYDDSGNGTKIEIDDNNRFIIVHDADSFYVYPTTSFYNNISLASGQYFLFRDISNTWNAVITAGTQSSNITLTLPIASGTIALTSDITGTNSGTNTGDQNLDDVLTVGNTSTLGVTLNGASSYLLVDNSTHQILLDDTLSVVDKVTNDNVFVGGFDIQFVHNTSTFQYILNYITPTANRTVSIPNASGTIALTSDITGTNSGTNTGNQTIANTSDATSHTATLSASGGSIQLVEGAGITLTTTGTGLNGIVTIASTGGGALEWATYTGTRALSNLDVILGDYDASGKETTIEIIDATNDVLMGKIGGLYNTYWQFHMDDNTPTFNMDLYGSISLSLTQVFADNDQWKVNSSLNANTSASMEVLGSGNVQIKAEQSNFTSTLDFTTPTATATYKIPAKPAATYTVSLLSRVLDDVSTTRNLVLADANEIVTLNNGAAVSVVIPANGSIPYPIGTIITLINKGAGTVTISITTDTLNHNVGGLTMAQYDKRTLLKITSTEWILGY